MYRDILFILLPLILGYCIRLRSKSLLSAVNKILSAMVYLILFLMGVGLAFIDDLQTNLLLIIHYTSVFACIILSLNILALMVLERCYPWNKHQQQQPLLSRWVMLFNSLTLCVSVLIGFLCGLTHCAWLKYAADSNIIVLMVLLFMVGVQLGNSGIRMKQILLNPRGMLIAIITLLSSLIGGMIAAILLGLPSKIGLALASGYGWYSLSGIVITGSLGPVMGSTAFFNDLIRELVAIILIPLLASKYRSTALGIAGATSMDFTLPILQRSAGIEIVPAAVIHGFILSLCAPIFLVLFSK